MISKFVFPDESEILRALQDLNPLWASLEWNGIPSTRRSSFYDAIRYLQQLGSQRAIFLRGFRGVGKSTLLRQIAAWLGTEQNIHPRNIVYVDFEKRPLRQIPWSLWFSAWEHHLKPAGGPIYLLLDEIQYAEGWVHEVRSLLTDERYRIIVTGSAASEIQDTIDEEVRRWISLRIPPLLFHEYLMIFRPGEYARLQGEDFKDLRFSESSAPDPVLLKKAFDLLEGPFKDYVLRGGFPETAHERLTLREAQILLADVVDKALYQDMRSQFSRHDIENLGRLLEYVCRHPGALLDKSKVSAELEVSRPTMARYVKSLVSGDFIMALQNHHRGGKKALKAKPKLYPADASMRNAILGRPETVLLESDEMGGLVEGSVAAHLEVYARANGFNVGYWRRNEKEEMDFIVQKTDGKYWILESKYGRKNNKLSQALRQWPSPKRVDACFLITRNREDAGRQASPEPWPLPCFLQAVPAPVFLYLLGRESATPPLLTRSEAGQTGATTISVHVNDAVETGSSEKGA